MSKIVKIGAIAMVAVFLVCLVPTASVEAEFDNNGTCMNQIAYVDWDGTPYWDSNIRPNPAEYFVIWNPTSKQVNIGGYYITDVGPEETLWYRWGGEGIIQFPKNTKLDAGQAIYVAQSAQGFYDMHGFYPDFEVEYDSNPDVPQMIQVRGQISLEQYNGYLAIINDEIESQDLIDALEQPAGTPHGIDDYIEDEYFWDGVPYVQWTE